ncbi:MAG: aspartate/glutamate racemase family protein [Pseudomonadota bacterium]
MAGHIGLIGGIGPAATDYYYRQVISSFAATGVPLDLTMVHADTPTLLNNQRLGNTGDQVQVFCRLANRLRAAGAELAVVTSIAGHFCIEDFKDASPLPVVDLIESVDQAAVARKLRRIGILGTEVVMRSQFYGGLSRAEALAPPDTLIGDVHEAYVTMAASGFVTDEQRRVFDAACEWFLKTAGVDAVMLGGTDLAMVYSAETSDFPILDCAAIHADTVVSAALSISN